MRLLALLGGSLSVGLLLQVAAPWAVAESDLPAPRTSPPEEARQAGFPLPPGVSKLREPTQVDLGGASTLHVQSFLTRLDEPAVLAFYRKELPKTGWRLSRLPWQADQDTATERLEKAVRYRRDLPEEVKAKLKTRLKDFQQTAQAMQRQIYATRGSERVIVNLWPMKGAGIMVFINRWSGSRSWMEGDHRPVWTKVGSPTGQPTQGAAEAPRGMAQANGLMTTNVCCSAEEVPDLKGPLPFFLPRYPNARAMARSSSQNGERTMILLMAPGGAEEVSAYYRTEMPRDGWELVNDQQGPSQDGTATKVLTFQKPGRLCVVTVQGTSGQPAAQGQGSGTVQTLVRIAVEPHSFRGQL